MSFILARIPKIAPWQRTLYIMFVAQFMVAVGFSSIFPFLPFYVEELGSTTSLGTELLSGLVFSAQAFAMMISAAFWGILADRWGRKLMVERSMFGGAIILLGMAFVRSAEELILLRAVQGLVTGTIAAANALVAAEAPRNRTGYAMGLLQVGFGTGIALGPLIGGAVADAYGYSQAFYITAVLLFLAGILVLVGVRENFKADENLPRKRTGFLKQWRRILLAEGVAPTYGMEFLTSLGRMMVIPIIPYFVEMLMADIKQLNTFTGLMMGVSSGATTLSAVFLGKLGDRVGHRPVLIACSLALVFLYVPQSFVTAAWQLLVLQVLVGIALGGILPTISALLAGYTRHGEEGAVYGLDNSINAAGRSVAPLIGAWAAAGYGIRATFVATGAVFLLGVIFAVIFLPTVSTTEAIPVSEAEIKI